MPDKHPSQPASSFDDKSEERSDNSGSADTPVLLDAVLDQNEKPTEPARRRPPKFSRGLIRGAGTTVTAADEPPKA
jgi:hypothetical protein